MKHRTKLFLALIGVLSVLRLDALHTQIINLSTGTTAVGTTDPIWTVLSMPNGAAANAIVSNASITYSSGGTPTTGSWATNACGRWISPHTALTPANNFGTVIGINGQGGNYIYRMTFNANSSANCVISATLDLNQVGADNSISWIRVNGTQNSTSGISFNPLTSINMNVASQLVNGLNTIDVCVSNLGQFTGLMLCGSLTVNYDDSMTSLFTTLSPYCNSNPITVNGSASTGCFINDHVWIVAECDVNGNLVAGATEWWSPFFLGAPGAYTFPSFAAGGPNLQCSRYYRVKLALQNSTNVWVESTQVISIKCAPIANAGPDATICPGHTQNVGTPVGLVKQTSFIWTYLDNGSVVNAGSGQQIPVNPTQTTTYTLTVTNNMTGCAVTDEVTITVVPSNLNINISTGIDDLAGTGLTVGSNDDSWKIRGIPGNLYTGPHSSLTDAKVVSPYSGSYGPWANSTASAKWISTTSNASGQPQIVNFSQTDNTFFFDNNYWFELEFNLPVIYQNLRIEIPQAAVDNWYFLYLNCQQMLTGGTSYYYHQDELPSWYSTNYSVLHNQGNVATDQSHYRLGTNNVLMEVGNGGGMPGGSFMGLLLNARVKGECAAAHSMIISEEEMHVAKIEATTNVFPNPSSGNFKIECGEENITSVTIKDALGKLVKELKNINTGSLELSLENENKGLYFVEIKTATQAKPIFRKLVIQ